MIKLLPFYQTLIDHLDQHLLKYDDQTFSIKKVKSAWSNDVYQISGTNETTYFLKIKRKKETLLEKAIFTKFYLGNYFRCDSTGNTLMKSLPQHYQINKWYLKSLFLFINQLTNYTPDVEQIDFKYDEYIKDEPMFHPYYRSAEISKYLSFYHTLYCILRNENKLVLSHNDLSVWNILDDEKKGIFQVIDFEYAAYNIPYWDIFNFLRDLTGEDFQLTFNLIKETYHLDLSFMYQMLFLTSFYAYTWAVFMYLKEGWNELKEYLLKQQKNFILFYDKVFHSSKF